MAESKGSPVKDEHGLASKHKAEDQLDHQRFKRIFKYLIALILGIAVIVLTFFIFCEFCKSSPFREKITEIILSNSATITVSLIAFLGLAKK